MSSPPNLNLVVLTMATAMDETQLAAVAEGVDAALDDINSKVTCRLCNLYVDPMHCVQKGKDSWICNQCQNINMILYRNLGGRPQELSEMSINDQREFWQRAHALDEAEGQSKWKVVRAALVEVRSKEVCRREVNSLQGSYLPMAVHLKAGWTKEQVESYKDFEDHPDPVGRLWRIPVKSIAVEDIKSSIEKELLTRERTFKKKRAEPAAKAGASKKIKTGADNADPEPEEDKAEESRLCFFIPSDSDDEVVAVRKRAKGGDKNSAKALARAKAAAERKEEREAAASMKSATALASKSIAQLNSLTNNLQGAKISMEKKGPEKFGEDLPGMVEEALTKLSEWKSQVTTVLSKSQNKQKFDGLTAVSFNKKEFITETKAAQSLLSDFRFRSRELNAAKAGSTKPKSASKKKAKK